MVRLGVLASGRGSNFAAIAKNIKEGFLNASVQILITDNPYAEALQFANEYNIPYQICEWDYSNESYYDKITELLRLQGVELVILAGFRQIIKQPLINTFSNRIMNIHPSLLPAFPGRNAQHKALEAGVKVSGCTVHFVDEGMDTGPIIAQSAVVIMEGETEDTLSTSILNEEHKLFSKCIQCYVDGGLAIENNKVHVFPNPLKGHPFSFATWIYPKLRKEALTIAQIGEGSGVEDKIIKRTLEDMIRHQWVIQKGDLYSIWKGIGDLQDLKKIY